MASSHPGSLDLDNNKFLQLVVASTVFLLKWLLRPFARRNNDILVISFNNIGDSILSLPALTQLKNENPGTSITLLTYFDLGFLFETSGPDVKKIFVERDEFRAGGKIPTVKVIREARRARAGIIINFSENPQSVFTMLFSGGKHFHGISRKAYSPAFDKFNKMRDLPHLQDIYFDAVDSYKKTDRAATERVFPLRESRGNEIILTPFAGWDEKMWGLENMITLTERLSKKHPVNFVVEQGKLSREFLADISGRGIKVTVLSSLVQYLPHLQNAVMLVANDTGPVHLAAWYGIPTVAIFGPTNPDFCKQPGDHHLAIHRKLHCTPSRYNYCELDAGRSCPARVCLTGISVDEVEAAVLAHLEKFRSR